MKLIKIISYIIEVVIYGILIAIVLWIIGYMAAIYVYR